MRLVVERLGWGKIVEKKMGDGVVCRETWLGGKRRKIRLRMGLVVERLGWGEREEQYMVKRASRMGRGD